MGEYFTLSNNFLWNEIAFALEMCTLDCMGSKIEKVGYEQLKNICNQYGAIQTIECLIGCLKKDYVFELSLLAKAQVKEVIPYLEIYLNSDDEDDLTDAICGLIHFDHPLAWDLLEKLIKQQHFFQLSLEPSWYFGDELRLFDTDKARELEVLLYSKNSEQ